MSKNKPAHKESRKSTMPVAKGPRDKVAFDNGEIKLNGVQLASTPQEKLTGGDVNYYLVHVPSPKRLAPYTMEVEDIIEALDMSFAEATVFKSLIRRANARKGLGKPGNKSRYDAEKMVYYSQRELAKEDRAGTL